MIDITPLIRVTSKLTLNLPNSNSEIFGTFVHHHCTFTLALKPDILIFDLYLYLHQTLYLFLLLYFHCIAHCCARYL